jgi:hypothetical protein
MMCKNDPSEIVSLEACWVSRNNILCIVLWLLPRSDVKSKMPGSSHEVCRFGKTYPVKFNYRDDIV